MSTTFSHDILPLFRPGDISCMKRKHVHLDDPDYMCDPTGGASFADHAHARTVYEAISSGEMPPDGLWPADRVALFLRWMDQGFNR
jgi:hypothetical protein